jgi:hypothetical protein
LFLALETLSLRAEGQASLWRLVKHVQDRYVGLVALVAGGEARREVLEAERAAAGRRTFADLASRWPRAGR